MIPIDTCNCYHKKPKTTYLDPATVKYITGKYPENNGAVESEIGVCWGTREQDECKCGGDKDKCDFYDYVRSKSDSDDKVGKISLLTYCSYHPEQLAERMTDWLENILQSADIELSKESIVEQRKLLVDYFNTTIFDDSDDKTKST